MGASSSSLSGSNLKEKAEKREIVEERVPLTHEQHKSDTTLREMVAGRIYAIYPDRKLDEVTRLAINISDGKRLQETYFPSFLDDCNAEGSLYMSIIWRDIINRENRRELEEAFQKFAPGFKYGPFCATVQIGAMYLEWDNRELVIPHFDVGSLFEEGLFSPSSSRDGEGIKVSGAGSSSDPPLALGNIKSSAVFRETIKVDMSFSQQRKLMHSWKHWYVTTRNSTLAFSLATASISFMTF